LQSKAMANCPTFPGLGLLRWRLKAEEATEKLYSEQLAFLEQAFERMPGLVEGRNLNPLPTKTPKPKKKAKRIGATAASNLSTATTATIGADDIYGPLSVEMLGVQASSKRRSRSPINGANAASNTTGAGARTTRTRAVAAASAAPARSTRTGRAAAAAASAAISTNSTSARGRPAAAGRVVAESSKKRLRSPVAASPFTRGIVGTAEAEKKKQRTAGAAPYRAPACMTPAATAVSLSRAAGRSAFCRAAAAAASSPKGAKKASISTPAVNREAAAGSSYMTEDVSCQLVDPNVSLMSVDDGCAAAAVGRTPVAGQCSGGAGAPQSSGRYGTASTSKAQDALSGAARCGGGAAVSRASDDAAEERQRRRLLEEKERAEEERLRKRREKAEELRAQKARDKEEKRKRVLENAQKRQQEVQARSAQKLAQTELTGRVAQTLQAEAKRREETERKRRAEEEHRKAEEKRKAEEVQKKQEEQRRKNEEAERERKAAEEEERRKLAEKQEADRKRSAARKLAEEEAERKRAAEEAERKRLAAAEEAKKKAAEEAERNRKAKEEEAERQRKAAAEEAERRRKAAEEAVAAVQAEERESQLAWKKQSEALKVSQPFVPTTAYEKKLIPPPRSSPQTYPLDDLNSDAETDNEDAPRHALPRWVQGNHKHRFFAKQTLRGPHWWSVFKPVETLDLAATMKLVFPAAAEKAPRSSSAVWNTPPGANLRKIVNSQKH
uniref:INCENP_ARK-bind domain-containing protein n=1 Tax=Macrostomum lignano TaxID=282301 RepID=A0A1I8J1F7_9PLAT